MFPVTMDVFIPCAVHQSTAVDTSTVLTFPLVCLFLWQEVSIVQVWEDIHQFKSGQLAPCTALGVCRGGGGAVTVVTGGEDGRISVLRPDSQKPLRVIGNK